MIIGIDPGTEKSAMVVIDRNATVLSSMIDSNDEILARLCLTHGKHLAIEMVASYGMPVGESTFETVCWIGRFIQAHNGPHTKVYRKRQGECDSVGMYLCKSNRANDATIRQAIIDRYPATGGGAKPQIGTKKEPGPLYGVRSHEWSALAVALTYLETAQDRETSE